MFFYNLIELTINFKQIQGSLGVGPLASEWIVPGSNPGEGWIFFFFFFILFFYFLILLK